MPEPFLSMPLPEPEPIEQTSESSLLDDVEVSSRDRAPLPMPAAEVLVGEVVAVDADPTRCRVRWSDGALEPHEQTAVLIRGLSVAVGDRALMYKPANVHDVVVMGVLPGTVPAPVETAAPPLEAVIDGRRVVLEGQDEIVLKCGESSITLRRNGRIVIRGAYVESRSRGVNRIKGGSVQIN